MGGGRATVPLGVVTSTRSVSDSHSRAGSTASNSEGARTPPLPSPSSTPSSSSSPSEQPLPALPILPSASALNGAAFFDRAELLRREGVMTPGSVSSLNVETGSLPSDSGADPASIENPIVSVNSSSSQPPSTSSAVSSARNSPLSSPIIEAALIEGESPIPISLSHSPNPTSAPVLRGPLDTLRAPPRSLSTISLSSMFVETGSVASVDDHKTDEEINAEEKTTPTSVSFPSVVGSDRDVDEIAVENQAKREAAEERREESKVKQTKLALDAYEKEAGDEPAAPVLASEEDLHVVPAEVPPPTVDHEIPTMVPTPILSTFEPLSGDDLPRSVTLSSLISFPDVSPPPHIEDNEEGDTTITTSNDPEVPGEEEGSYSNILDDLTDDKPLPPSPEVVPTMPTVKCSDCSANLSLAELGEHSCAPSSLPPAISSAPTSPIMRRVATRSPSPNSLRRSSMRPVPDVPTDDQDAALGSPRAGTSAGMTRSLSSSSSSKFSQKLDAFVAHTSSLIPQDVGDEEEEDDLDAFAKSHLDFDADDGADSPTDPAAFQHHHRQNAASFSLKKTLPKKASFDVPVDVEGEKTSRSTILQPRPKSVSIPGLDSDDEENYEGGSVTIVRTVHRS